MSTFPRTTADVQRLEAEAKAKEKAETPKHSVYDSAQFQNQRQVARETIAAAQKKGGKKGSRSQKSRRRSLRKRNQSRRR
jgi:hypothetical protein